MPSIDPSSSSNLKQQVSRSKIYQLKNCRLVRDGKIVKDDFWFRDGQILNPEPVFFTEKARADVTVDCQDALICPGFIDIQLNGGYGYDFSSDPEHLEEGVAKVSKGILSTGVTSFCPTVVTSSPELYHQVLPRLKPRPGGPEGAGILGVHLEGPFISMEKKGAHQPEFIRNSLQSVQDLSDVYGALDNVTMVTIAPELPGALDAIAHLANKWVTVSLGHSNGNLEDGEAAMNKGATFITHLFNAMLPFHHRDPGLVGLLTSRKVPHPVHYGIIADGIHTHPAALRIAHRTHPEGLVLVTDAMAAMGLSEGEHQIGQMKVNVSGQCARLVGSDTLAGSIVTMDYCVRQFIKDAGVSLVEAIEAATKHPALAIGHSHCKGSLNYGADADFLLLRDQGDSISILHTFIAGVCVYSAPTAPHLEYVHHHHTDKK
ncbi:hypothetical protein Pmani_026596 [Petrolisthes manimaculis]|uniref:N-acetylglucosamine-6-phosphate deacetylase n=1 Tax=Petrolisthes manimaculis TaxID=1843537 RepID=A0AAE1TWI1_9EUCA|nr:hypothetical protein Pmani_026596 [Petrolisthes manimaculis]